MTLPSGADTLQLPVFFSSSPCPPPPAFFPLYVSLECTRIVVLCRSQCSATGVTQAPGEVSPIVRLLPIAFPDIKTSYRIERRASETTRVRTRHKQHPPRIPPPP